MPSVNQEVGSTGHQICWLFDLGFPSLQSCQKETSIVCKPCSLCHSFKAAQASTLDNIKKDHIEICSLTWKFLWYKVKIGSYLVALVSNTGKCKPWFCSDPAQETWPHAVSVFSSVMCWIVSLQIRMLKSKSPITENLTVFGDRTFNGAIKLKWGH